MLKRIKREIIWKKIYEDLSFQTKDFRFGKRFYTLDEVCTKYHVSKITARRVFVELENEGYIERVRRKGTIVKNVRDPLCLKLLLPEDGLPREILERPAEMRINNALNLYTNKLKIDFATISEKFLQGLDLPDKIGFLLLSKAGKKTVEFLRKRDLPFILLHFPSKQLGVVSIRIDLRRGAYLATRYLASLGHRKIAFINGPITNVWFLPRFKGYLKALKEEKIKFDWLLIKETGGLDPKEDENALEELLALPFPPTAIFAVTDYRAIHILEYCQKHNIKVPQDLSIVGFDNISESSLTQPPLTTIDTCLEKVSEKGVNFIIEMMEEKAKKTWKDIIIKPDLVVRKSAKNYA
ncbi:MAG: substrate-binding domain-containing protein [Candidatus Omnitrophota bacterium]